MQFLAERYEFSLGQLVREAVHDYCKKRGLNT